MDYIEVEFKVSPYNEDIAEWIIAEVESCGFESFTMESPYVKGYIQETLFSEEALSSAMEPFSDLKGVAVSYKSVKVENKNWNEIWESGFSPIILDDRFSVRAPFHKNVPHAEYELVIEPKMAFGTGHHQTTLLMVGLMLLEKSFSGSRVMDLGCGTGILAILAGKMGAELPVEAIDIDDIAAASAEENAAGNGVSLHVRCGDASLIKGEKYDVLLANINRNILVNDMAVYSSAVRTGGRMFLSGFYEKDMPAVVDSAVGNGFRYVCHEVKDEWVAVKFEKRDD